MTKEEFSKLFDHTLLKPDAQRKDYERLAAEAVEHHFAGVCVPPNRLREVKTCLGASDVLAVTVIGFPLGYQTTSSKVNELEEAIDHGADEVDFVMPIGKFLEGDEKYVIEEFSHIRKRARRTILKTIVETSFLSEDQIAKMTRICADTGMDFIKTSTGYSSRGAAVKDIQIMADVIRTLKSPMKIKASGGIKTLQDVQMFYDAGATRIGSSASVAIMQNF